MTQDNTCSAIMLSVPFYDTTPVLILNLLILTILIMTVLVLTILIMTLLILTILKHLIRVALPLLSLLITDFTY